MYIFFHLGADDKTENQPFDTKMTQLIKHSSLASGLDALQRCYQSLLTNISHNTNNTAVNVVNPS